MDWRAKNTVQGYFLIKMVLKSRESAPDLLTFCVKEKLRHGQHVLAQHGKLSYHW